ncbi:MAG: thymidine kinase [Bdellovibrionales bacterium]|nr:thymidine kinase [Bdellovibrionales bacterium]
MQQAPQETGWIEVICGGMFSGKTEELIRRMRRAEIAKQNIVLFKPRMDDRYATDFVISHDKRVIEAVSVDEAKQIEVLAKNYDVVGIDEVQFFGPEIVEVCEYLANKGKRVIVSGLDQDYLGQPFDPMPTLLCVAEYITKELAICVVCGNPADRTQRIIDEQERVVIGGNEFYEARCRKCFKPGILTKAEIEDDY